MKETGVVMNLATGTERGLEKVVYKYAASTLAERYFSPRSSGSAGRNSKLPKPSPAKE